MSAISQVYFHIVDTEVRHFNTLPWYKRPFFRFKSKHSIFLEALANKSALDIATIAERALGYALPQFKQRPDLHDDTLSTNSSQSHVADDAKCLSQAPVSDDSNIWPQSHAADDANPVPTPSHFTDDERPQFSSISLSHAVLGENLRHVDSEVSTAPPSSARDATLPVDTPRVYAAGRRHVTDPEAANGSHRLVQAAHSEPVEMPQPSTQMSSIRTSSSFGAVATSKYSGPTPPSTKQRFPKQQLALTRTGTTTKRDSEAFEMVPTNNSPHVPAGHSVEVGQCDPQLSESKRSGSTLQQQQRMTSHVPLHLSGTASAKRMEQVLGVRPRNAKPSGAVPALGRSSSSQKDSIAPSSIQSRPGPRSSNEAELEEVVVHAVRPAIAQRLSHFPRN